MYKYECVDWWITFFVINMSTFGVKFVFFYIYLKRVYVNKLYYKKTGKELKFVPLYIDDQNRQIIAREPVTLLDFKEESKQAAERLEYLLNPIETEENITINAWLIQKRP